MSLKDLQKVQAVEVIDGFSGREARLLKEVTAEVNRIADEMIDSTGNFFDRKLINKENKAGMIASIEEFRRRLVGDE